MAGSDQPAGIAAALRTLIRHSDLLNTLALVAADHARIIERGFSRCHQCGERPATVRLRAVVPIECCDRCAAEAVIRGIEGGDEAWVDLLDAEVIRRVYDLVTISRQKDDPDRPTLH